MARREEAVASGGQAWVVVATMPTRTRAEIECQTLRAHGIECRVHADDAGGAAPHLALGQGGVRIATPAEDAEAATALLQPAATSQPARTPLLVWVGKGVLALAAAGAVVAVLRQAFA